MGGSCRNEWGMALHAAVKRVCEHRGESAVLAACARREGVLTQLWLRSRSLALPSQQVPGNSAPCVWSFMPPPLVLNRTPWLAVIFPLLPPSLPLPPSSRPCCCAGVFHAGVGGGRQAAAPHHHAAAGTGAAAGAGEARGVRGADTTKQKCARQGRAGAGLGRGGALDRCECLCCLTHGPTAWCRQRACSMDMAVVAPAPASHDLSCRAWCASRPSCVHAMPVHALPAPYQGQHTFTSTHQTKHQPPTAAAATRSRTGRPACAPLRTAPSC